MLIVVEMDSDGSVLNLTGIAASAINNMRFNYKQAVINVDEGMCYTYDITVEPADIGRLLQAWKRDADKILVVFRSGRYYNIMDYDLPMKKIIEIAGKNVSDWADAHRRKI